MAARSVSRRVMNSTPIPGSWPASGNRLTHATRAWVSTEPAPGTSKLKESDKGQAATAWADQWEGALSDDCDMEFPEAIELHDTDGTAFFLLSHRDRLITATARDFHLH